MVLEYGSSQQGPRGSHTLGGLKFLHAIFHQCRAVLVGFERRICNKRGPKWCCKHFSWAESYKIYVPGVPSAGVPDVELVHNKEPQVWMELADRGILRRVIPQAQHCGHF
jgi:hypothetical protein